MSGYNQITYQMSTQLCLIQRM